MASPGHHTSRDLSPTDGHWRYHGQPDIGFLGQLRLEVGLPGFLTGHNFETYEGLITPSWLVQVWKFVDRFHIGLRDSEVKLTERRYGDQFLR